MGWNSVALSETDPLPTALRRHLQWYFRIGQEVPWRERSCALEMPLGTQ